jgi:hypothetical protein
MNSILDTHINLDIAHQRRNEFERHARQHRTLRVAAARRRQSR